MKYKGKLKKVIRSNRCGEYLSYGFDERLKKCYFTTHSTRNITT